MGSKPRKPRPKSPSKVGSGKHPQKAPKSNYFASLMQTEEGRALRRQWSTKPRKNPGRPKGVPDGYRREQIEPIRARENKKRRGSLRSCRKNIPLRMNTPKRPWKRLLRSCVYLVTTGNVWRRQGSSGFHKIPSSIKE